MTFPPCSLNSSHRRLTRAVLALFLFNGAMIGVWGGSLAGLRERVGTDAGGIGITLVVTGLSAIVSMQLGGRLSDRITPRLPSLLSGFVIVAGLIVAAFAPSLPVLLAAGVLIGIGNGTMDVSMNALGVVAEQVSGRAIMSRFHAFFSLGELVGSGLIVATSQRLTHAPADPRAALLIVALLGALALAVLVRFTPAPPQDTAPRNVRSAESESQPTPEEHGPAEKDRLLGKGGAPAQRRVPPQAWLLGIMALFFGFTEGTAIDWASIHVTDVAGVDPGVGASGLVAVAATMVAIRLLGDALVARFARAAVVRYGAPVAVVGFTIVSTCSTLGLVIFGWLLVGLGVGMIAPQIYGIAGHLGGGRVLAIVTGCGYAAFLTGPAIIGFAASHLGIQRSMFIPLLAALLLTGMTFTRALNEPRQRVAQRC